MNGVELVQHDDLRQLVQTRAVRRQLAVDRPELRCGIEGGEVFVARGLATGAPIDAAGRLAERARPGEVLRRSQLTAAAWPHGGIVHDNTLDAYIARIRRKLRGLGAPDSLETVRGVGYVLR